MKTFYVEVWLAVGLDKPWSAACDATGLRTNAGCLYSLMDKVQRMLKCNGVEVGAKVVFTYGQEVHTRTIF